MRNIGFTTNNGLHFVSFYDNVIVLNNILLSIEFTNLNVTITAGDYSSKNEWNQMI